MVPGNGLEEGTARNLSDPEGGGVCSACRRDLYAEEDGHVYCSNLTCAFAGQPHPTRDTVNHGGLRRC